ncbi:sugar efflux transporter, putative [Bodo saltans]|uniref:Sugar efflux transporter, putative n=1 Tax=Bodo saltans TaxID=75058 RepID=A0A0S4JP06_BODSA|nr:sugar efflux transporter, putative [Bodo saltans]|eukprot:CUG91890.1 sugar efflux transporter, putative [Bodo saltans]
MDFNTAVSWIGTVTGGLLFIAPIVTIRKLAAAKDVGAMTCVYYIMQLLNCVAWTSYGSLVGSGAVVVCNLWGGATAIYCALTYLRILRVGEAEGRKNSHVTYDRSFRLCGVALAISVGFCVILLIAASMSMNTANSIAGLVAGTLSVSMLASPLESVKHIIASKSAEVLSPPTLAMALLNGFVWTFYGLLTTDPFIAVPNGLGMIFTTLLGSLLLRYGRGSGVRLTSPNLAAVRVTAVPLDTPQTSDGAAKETQVIATPTDPSAEPLPISLALNRSMGGSTVIEAAKEV